MSKKCETCGKSVYPVEALNVGDTAFHKGCFKCTVCGIRLTIEKYVLRDKKIHCQKCNPLQKQVGSAVTWESENAKKAEALKRDAAVGVKNIIRSGDRGTQSAVDFHGEQHKKNAQMRADATKIRSVVITGDRGTQSGIDKFTEQAMKVQQDNKNMNQKGTHNIRSPGTKPSAGGTGYEFGASSSSGAEGSIPAEEGGVPAEAREVTAEAVTEEMEQVAVSGGGEEQAPPQEEVGYSQGEPQPEEIQQEEVAADS